jgi:chemotaxis response regulator CheB
MTTRKTESTGQKSKKNTNQTFVEKARFPIVGIGASAGGLTAFEA